MQSLIMILPKIECEHKGAARQINDFVILSGDIIRDIVLENHLAFFQSNDYKVLPPSVGSWQRGQTQSKNHLSFNLSWRAPLDNVKNIFVYLFEGISFD